MRHDIMAISELSRISYVRMERSVIPPRSDDSEGDMAI